MNPIDREKLGKSAPDLLSQHMLLGQLAPTSLTYHLVRWASNGTYEELSWVAGRVITLLGGIAPALLAAGDAMAYGRNKHGQCTWRIADTEQAKLHTHYASALRHLLEFEADAGAVESGSGLPVLAHALAQISIIYDILLDPPESDTGDTHWEVT